MVTRNGWFQVPKGYSRVSVKRDTDRFAEEDYFGEQALRRFQEREPIPPRLVDLERPVPAQQHVRQRPAQPARLLDSPVVVAPEPPEPEVAPATAESPARFEPLRRRRIRLRHEPPPGWFARLWRRLFGR